MARPRVPRASALASTVARALGLGASVVLLANLIYESVNWGSRGKTYGVSITTAVVALVVDGSEVMALLDSTRSIPRFAPPCLVCGDIIILCIAIPSVFLILLSDYQGLAPEEGFPWADADFLSFVITTIICGLRFVFLIWSFIACVYWIRGSGRAERRGSEDTPMDSTGGLRDIENDS
ncbi:hypothetical protein F5B20DRAFT_497994 [Whalleya microplaca]|nr:hypothetical protein F5B20DRAFT_497994 [Whalleya microplaca]